MYRGKNPNYFRRKGSFLKKQHLCLSPYYQIKVLCCENIFFYIKHNSEGKSCRNNNRNKNFPHRNKICFSSWSKEFLFLLSFVKLMKMFCQNTKLFEKRFFPIKAFDKYTLCISIYYKCNDE